MNVRLIRYTPGALNLLLSTKNTRLSFEEDIAEWSEEKKMENLAYMKDTIKSSWEFVDYVFQIEGVSRAFTHQFVRTRAGSYAQESLRVVDARDHEVVKPGEMTDVEEELWARATITARESYAAMLNTGSQIQNARGILPIATATNIVAKLNLRTLHEMAQVRMCVRTQGEYQDVFRAMRNEVVSVHPWAIDFIQVACVQNGTCAFPRYGKEECPVYHPSMDLSAVKELAREKFWSLRFEAEPNRGGNK